MNLKEIKERYDYDNPNGDFFYESINCAEAVQRSKDFRWLIEEVGRLEIIRANLRKLFQKYRELAQNQFDRAEKAEAEAAEYKRWWRDEQAAGNRLEADKAKIIPFIQEVRNSADRSYLRVLAEKLLEEL